MPAYKWSKDSKESYRYLIYGVAGVGKTSLSKYLKGRTYLLSLDDSFHRIKFWQGKNDIWAMDTVKPIEDISEFVTSFNSKDYNNLIIDNVSNLQKLWFIEKAKETKSGLDNKIQDYGEFNNWMIRFITKIFSYNLNVLVTAWEKQSKITDSSGQEFEQYGPDLRENPRDYLMGNCDIVARMIQKPKTDERGLIMQGSIETYAKNRLDNRKGCKADELFV